MNALMRRGNVVFSTDVFVEVQIGKISCILWWFSTLSNTVTTTGFDFSYCLPILNASQVGRTTLGGLLALGYSVVVSFKRTSRTVNRNQLLVVAETIDTLNESFLVLKGPSRKV